MNKFIISISFLLTLILHLSIIHFFKTNNIESNQTIQNSTLILQLTKINEIKKEVTQEKTSEHKIEQKKEIIKKEVPKKLSNPTITKTEKITKEEKSDTKTANQEVSSTQEISSTSIQKDSQEQKADDEKYLNQYKTKLREEINKYKIYPNVSKKLKEEGKVVVSFRVLKNGQFTNIEVHLSSDKERLDKAALNALYDTKEFEPFDNNIIHKEYLDFEVPIDFKLY